MEKLRNNILLMLLCMIFLSSCQSDEKHPIFRQSAEEINKLWLDMVARNSSDYLGIEEQCDNIEQQEEFNFFVYQITSNLTNLSVIGDLLNMDSQTDPNMAAYLFGMVNSLIYQNRRMIRQSSGIITSSDNQALKVSYQKTIPYLQRMNNILEPLEIPLIKASGDDPKKVKEQLEWWWALTTGKS